MIMKVSDNIEFFVFKIKGREVLMKLKEKGGIYEFQVVKDQDLYLP